MPSVLKQDFPLQHFGIIIIIIIIIIITEIQLSPGGSSPCAGADKTHKNKYTYLLTYLLTYSMEQSPS